MATKIIYSVQNSGYNNPQTNQLKNLLLGLCSFFKLAKIENRRISGLAAMT